MITAAVAKLPISNENQKRDKDVPEPMFDEEDEEEDEVQEDMELDEEADA